MKYTRIAKFTLTTLMALFLQSANLFAQQPPTGPTKCVSGNCVNGKGKKVYVSGNIYEGDFVNGEREGQGILKLKNGEIYTGQYANDFPNGKGKYVYVNGDIYEGDFVNGKRAGRGTFTSENGDVYTGQFANNKYNGKGKFESIVGYIYEGDFVDGKKEGQGKEKGIFDNVYNGHFSNDQYNGKGKLERSLYSDDIYEGNFVNGEYEGQGTETSKNGDYYTGEWKNGKRNGYGKSYTKATNTTREGNWKDDAFVAAASSTATNSIADVSETAVLLRDTLNGKFDNLEDRPLVYKVTLKKPAETLFYKIEFISDGGKLAFRWKETTKNEQSEKLVITDGALVSAGRYVNFFSTKTALSPDKEIAFILSQTLYKQLKASNEISLDLGKGPQRMSFNYNLTAITGLYTSKNLKLLYLQADDIKTKIEILDDPTCPLIVGIETAEYKLQLTSPPIKTSKTEAEWKKVCEPFVSKMEAAVNTKKDDASAIKIYADFDAATKDAGTSTSVRNSRKSLLKTMHQSNSYPLIKFVREKLETLNFNEEEKKEILSPRLYYV